MTDIDELRALTADIRELLTDAILSGSLTIPSDLPLPPGLPAPAPAPAPAPEPASATTPRGGSGSTGASTPVLPSVPADPPRPSAVAARWAALAADARSEATLLAESGAEGLKRVRDDLGDCRRCGLCTERRTIVYGVGDPEADLVIVGEGPGHDEDLKGEPFVGPAGQMLDKMLENVLKLRRDQVYIANVVKCRPPGNRNPLPDEIAACSPFLLRQIRAIKPKALLVLGNIAMKTLFRTDRGITGARGQWLDWEGVPAMPTFHPAYLLRNPADKRHTFDDLKQLRALYDERGGRR